MTHYPTKVYLNGEIQDAEDAKISVFDRGFLFGDGVYEVMTQTGGSFFYQQAHFKRLTESLAKTRIDFDVDSLPAKIEQLLRTANLLHQDCLLYIQITRGIAPRKHDFPVDISPSLMMYALPRVFPDINENHLSVITMPDYRWARCDIKMTSLLGNVMANDHAIKQGVYEALLVRDGNITEASHSNVFFVKDGVVYTHPVNEYILNGITRQITVELCHDLGIEIREEAVPATEVANMDEVFLTGTSTRIASVKYVDQHEIYLGEKPGAITKQLQQGFRDLREQHRRKSALSTAKPYVV
ncbi:MAG: aminotransferase class IV [Bacteroidota bacterium]